MKYRLDGLDRRAVQPLPLTNVSALPGETGTPENAVGWMAGVEFNAPLDTI